MKKLATTKFSALKNARSLESNVNVVSNGAVRNGIQNGVHAIRGTPSGSAAVAACSAPTGRPVCDGTPSMIAGRGKVDGGSV